MPPRVSIIVPVYNEESILRPCLDSLLRVRYPRELLEIIVVDNNSTDSSADIIKTYPVRYLFEGRKGRSAARNTALRVATGDIIAFTDADCIVGKNWIKNLVGSFTYDNIGCCGGMTLSYKPQNWIEKSFYLLQKNQYESTEFNNFDHESYFTEPLFASCNLACRRMVFDTVGYFDENFVAAEDSDLVWRANLAGFQIKHVKNAVVFHKHRDSVRQLPEVFCEYMYWQYWLVKKYQDAIGMSFNWFKILTDIVKDSVYAVLSLLGIKKRDRCVYHIFRVLFSFMGVAVNVYGLLESLCGKGRKFMPLSFTPRTVLWRWDREGNIKIVDLKKKLFYYFSGTSARIWELIVAGKNISDICAAIADEYECNEKDVENDVNALVKNLVNEGLLSDDK